MALSAKHLTTGEHIERELRTHPKDIFGPVLVGVVLLAVFVAALIWLPDSSYHGWLLLAIGVVLLVIAVIAVLVPILRWWTSVYVITNKRIITRHGIVSRSGRDIPLYRINDVSYEKGASDRIFGCGTLLISDASEQPPLRLPDVPRVESVQVLINELLFAHEESEGIPGERPARSAVDHRQPVLDYDGDDAATRPLPRVPSSRPRGNEQPYNWEDDERY